MSIQLTVPPKRELKPRITVIGVGGAGGNAVNNMIKAGLNGVDFVVANTDAQALTGSHAERRIQMGAQLTEGLGAGSDPEIGRGAAEEAMAEIVDQIQGSHMVFVTAGMGGGTGTGAAPVIARACREQGILTVGVVTKPFEFEGPRRMRSAESGISDLAAEVDTLIIIPNQNLFRVANEQTGFVEAFAIADEVLHSGVASVTDLMTKPGLINLDFADVKMVMNEMGKAMMGTGEASGENRALDAAEAAIANPLLEDDSMQGATGVLINITGGNDMTLYEVDEAATRIKKEVSGEANIIIGAIYDETLEGAMRVSVVATGIDTQAQAALPVEGPRVVQLTQQEQPEIAPAPLSDASESAPAAEEETAAVQASPAPERSTEETASQASEDSAMPGFLRPATSPPRDKTVTKRRQSFLDRVLRGGKTKSEAEPKIAPSVATPSAPLSELVPDPVIEASPESVVEPEQEVAMAQPVIEDAPKVAEASQADMKPLMMEEPVREEIQAPIPAGTLKAELERADQRPEKAESEAAAPVELETAQNVSEAQDNTASEAASEAVEPDLADIVEKVQQTAQFSEPETASEAVTVEAVEPVEAAPAVSDISAPELQPVQTTVQTTMSTGSFDDAQLDIPAFLKRGQ